MSEKMREEFEAAVLNSELLPCNSIVKLEGSDEYSSVITGVAWLSWQISRAAMCIELPLSATTWPDGTLLLDREKVEESLYSAGVRYK